MIHVVAAAVTDAQSRVLIAQRPQSKPLAGGWEFPGGKIEPGETRVQALNRELREELGILLTGHPRPLMRLRHTYPYGEVVLDMWIVNQYSGGARGMDGQAIRWCTQEELEAATDLLPADEPVVRALRLPERLTATVTRDYAVGDADDDFGVEKLRGVLFSTAGEAVSAARSGVADFLVMHGSLPAAELASICASVDVPIFARGCDLDAAWVLGLSGVSDF